MAAANAPSRSRAETMPMRSPISFHQNVADVLLHHLGGDLTDRCGLVAPHQLGRGDVDGPTWKLDPGAREDAHDVSLGDDAVDLLVVSDHQRADLTAHEQVGHCVHRGVWPHSGDRIAEERRHRHTANCRRVAHVATLARPAGSHQGRRSSAVPDHGLTHAYRTSLGGTFGPVPTTSSELHHRGRRSSLASRRQGS